MELLPCPFCGYTDSVWYDLGFVEGEGYDPAIFCENCSFSFHVGFFGYGLSKNYVKLWLFDHWNKRPRVR